MCLLVGLPLIAELNNPTAISTWLRHRHKRAIYIAAGSSAGTQHAHTAKLVAL